MKKIKNIILVTHSSYLKNREIKKLCSFLSRESISLSIVPIDKSLDRGKGDVVFSRINPFDVYPDPQSRDFLYRDAAFILVKKKLTRNQLKQMYPEYARKIEGFHS